MQIGCFLLQSVRGRTWLNTIKALYLDFMASSLLENSQSEGHNDQNLSSHFITPPTTPTTKGRTLSPNDITVLITIIC